MQHQYYYYSVVSVELRHYTNATPPGINFLRQKIHLSPVKAPRTLKVPVKAGHLDGHRGPFSTAIPNEETRKDNLDFP